MAPRAPTERSDGVAGLFNVGTLETHRRRGYGRAVSIAAMAAGRERGLVTGVLQATEMGEPVYRALGFRRYGDLLMAAREHPSPA